MELRFVSDENPHEELLLKPSQSPDGDSSPKGGAFKEQPAKALPLGELSAKLTERVLRDLEETGFEQ